MVKASPAKNNFNGGEVSPLVWQRQDLERYPSFMRVLKNCVAAPQGPAIGRSGTRFQHRAYANDKYSHLIPFVFSDTQTNLLEFSHLKMRVLSDAGLLTTGFEAVTAVADASPLTITSAALAGDVTAGDHVALSGFAPGAGVEAAVFKVNSVSGNDIELDGYYFGATGSVSASAAKVYEIDTPYDHEDVRGIVEVQSLDVVYLFCSGYAPRKLSRYGETDWRLVALDFIDGPYLDEVATGDTLTPDTTGGAIEAHTANTGTYGVASASAGTAWQAFDNDNSTAWSSGEYQIGTLNYVFNTAKVIEGYVLYASRYNANAIHSAQADRLATWTVEASVDGSTNWTVIDEQYGYALWRNYRTAYIPLRNKTAYRGYRIKIISLEGLGEHTAKIAKWVLRERGQRVVRLTASSVDAINKGAGFASTDVGRLVRVHQLDDYWRSLKITNVVSPTVVDAALQGEPLFSLSPVTRWRLGAFSDTTGWPTTGSFFEDRLVLGGAFETPTGVALSAPQQYETFAPTDADGTVNAANGMFLRPNTRNATPLRWLIGADRGLIMGFGSGEWVLGSASATNPFGATNVKASLATSRGSAAVQAVQVDNQVLFVQANGKTLREYAYAFETDSFKSPSMSLFASHLGKSKFVQLVYAAEPHSIAWLRREDGTIVGLTYNREESIVGWHTHDFGGEIESIAVLPGPEDQDDLWLVIKRETSNGFVRNIEKLTPFWTFNSELNEAYYVDCGRRVVNGSASTTVYEASHLEGERVYGLADRITFGYEEAIVVENGKFEIPFPATNVVYGLPYEIYGETVGFEAGAGEGTAQGKSKRIHNATIAVWDTYGGEIGIQNEDSREVEFTQVAGLYEQDAGLDDVQLFTGFVGPFNPPQGYGKKASIIFRQTKPFPFNIVAIYPQMATEDR